MKTGLVLEGGGMRGLFSAGVIDVMMENGIKFDGAVGVSAGAAFGCNYKSEQIGRVLRYNTRFCSDKRYSGLGCLIKTGNLYSTEFAYGDVPLKYDPFDFETYEKNPMEFYVVCTDVNSGKPVYHKYLGRADHGFDWIRASASLPLVSKIVKIDGLELLDGGMADSIPVRFFMESGYSKNVVVLTQPRGYLKKKNPLVPLISVVYKKYPKLVEAMNVRHEMYNETLSFIEEQEALGNIFVIRPEAPLNIGKIEKNPEKLREVYTTGRSTAEKLLPEMKKWLGSPA